MIILYSAGADWRLPEVSPYCLRTEVHLKMAGLAYEKRPGLPSDGPKGQLPWIDDDGELIADSAFVRRHIEARYGFDFDAGLNAEQRAVAAAVDQLLDHGLEPALVYFRWMDPSNFERGPVKFFNGAPAAVAEQAVQSVRMGLMARGPARHSPHEIVALARGHLETLQTLLGDKPFLMGNAPCGTDALMYAVLAGIMTPHFISPLQSAAMEYAPLVRYVERMAARFYPEFTEVEAA